jgi:hypothetical protein
MVKNLSAIRRPRVLMAVIVITVQLLSCAGSRGRSGGDLREGWVDDDTYQMYIQGERRQGIVNIEYGKKTAVDAALRRADSIFTERLTAMFYNGACDEFINPGRVPQHVIKSALPGKTVVAARYDADGNCNALIRIYRKNLKKDLGGNMPSM